MARRRIGGSFEQGGQDLQLKSATLRAGVVAVVLAVACAEGGDASIPLPAPSGIPEAAERRDRAAAGDARARYAYARWLHARDAYGAAATVYAAAQPELSDPVERAEAAWLRALALHQAGLDPDPALAIARVDAAALPQVWRLSAERALDAGHATEAFERAGRAESLDPEDPVPMILAARARLSEGRLDDAAAIAERALRKAPNDPAARHVAASMRVRRGDSSAAALLRGVPMRRADVVRDPVYRRVLLERDDARAARLRAESVAAAGDYRAARALLTPFEATTDDVEFLLQKADLDFRLGATAAADAVWEKVAARDDAPAVALERRATRMLDLGASTTDVAAVARRALLADPDAMGARLALGACALKDGRTEEALDHLNAVCAARPEWELARRLRADAERNMPPRRGAKP